MHFRPISLVLLTASLPLFFSTTGTAGVKVGDPSVSQPKGEVLKQPASFSLPSKGLRYRDQDSTPPVFRNNAGTYYYPQGSGFGCGSWPYGQTGYLDPTPGGVPGAGFYPGPNEDRFNPPPKMRPLPGGPVGPLPGYSSVTNPGNVVPVNFRQVDPGVTGYGLVNQNASLNPPPRMRDVPYAYPVSIANQPARIQISVPASNAEVWVEGLRMTSTGMARNFVTPPLAAGKYHYEIVVRWSEQGQTLTRTQNISVRPGERVAVKFAN